MTTVDGLSKAAQALRDSVAGLPEAFRVRWDLSGGDYPQVVPVNDPPMHYVVANANLAAEHIARTASPDVVAALADLLDAIGPGPSEPDDYAWALAVETSSHALAALINRES